jgi:hypothetical protein
MIADPTMFNKDPTNVGSPSRPGTSSKESLESANLYHDDINNLQFPFPLSGRHKFQALATLG